MNLKGQFLLAMPGMEDPRFIGALIFVCEHDDKGAFGLVINEPLEMSFGLLLEKMELPSLRSIADNFVFCGGPVQPERGFLLHDGTTTWGSTLTVMEDLHLTTSTDLLSAIADGTGPQHCLMAMGYSGWGAGQLEDEIAKNAWLTCKLDREILFEMQPQERYEAALKLIGLNPEAFFSMGSEVGHA